ncbi:MAG TPA: NAD(P)H-dependent oxidoreductase subunit E [Thermoanaerobaculia bacterium]|nr:NAD(P)H-dependent oxidoreductase subunit E [Thermoanaerobaculia bacterium]
MDLHFTQDEPTADERAAVDAELGAPQTGWTGGARDSAADGRTSGGGLAAQARPRLLPTLHAIQSRIGWISPGALNYASLRLGLPPAETYGVASFYGLFSTVPRPPVVVHVCDDIACRARGAEEMLEVLGSTGVIPSSATWLRSPCLGLCERAPAALLTVAGGAHGERVIAPATVQSIRGALSDPNVSGAPDVLSTERSVPQAGQPQLQPNLRLLSRVGRVDPGSLDAYLATGGYFGLAKAFEIGPERVVEEVLASKLLGRGGAAFPAGRKWQSARDTGRMPLLVCNADESEPGTFKDRVLIEGDPFALIEAMTIAGYAIGAELGYLYLRGEYPLAWEKMEHALETARKSGHLGTDILGKGVRFDIQLFRGAGAYICGEETALFNSIEGYRGEPRNKPPFPTQSGLFGRPTVVNNVETLVNVPWILREGGSAFAAIGTPGSTGTKLFCLSGAVARPGVYEVTFGATLREMLDLAGGTTGELRAILMGGAAGGFLGPADLDTPLTFEGLRAAGAALGSGVILAFDETVDLADILVRIAAFFRDESCGQCVPCRVGTERQEEILERLVRKRPIGSTDQEIALLKEMGQAMRDASICGLGHTASSAIESALSRWRIFS